MSDSLPSNVPFTLYCYNAVVIRVVDGDTINIELDEGFRHYWKVNARLAHINTPELTSSDPAIKAKAVAAKLYLAMRLPEGTVLNVISKKLDDYGRPIVQVYLNGVYINQEMIDKGYAVPFM